MIHVLFRSKAHNSLLGGKSRAVHSCGRRTMCRAPGKMEFFFCRRYRAPKIHEFFFTPKNLKISRAKILGPSNKVHNSVVTLENRCCRRKIWRAKIIWVGNKVRRRAETLAYKLVQGKFWRAKMVSAQGFFPAAQGS